jgi:hypothetical protein
LKKILKLTIETTLNSFFINMFYALNFAGQYLLITLAYGESCTILSIENKFLLFCRLINVRRNPVRRILDLLSLPRLTLSSRRPSFRQRFTPSSIETRDLESAAESLPHLQAGEISSTRPISGQRPKSCSTTSEKSFRNGILPATVAT